MNVYDVINTANKMRPGNNFDDDIVEQWISECDSSIQIEVCKKKPNNIRKLRASAWDSKIEYNKGEVVSQKFSGEWHQYKALNDVMPDGKSPNENNENWKEIPYDTYLVHPHDRLYVFYIIAMMDYANMEYNNYANDMAMYESALDEFAKWWQRTYGYTFKEGVDKYEADVRCT